MVVDGRLCTEDETHAAWCAQVSKQRAWVNPFDMAFDKKVESDASSALGRAWASRGRGWFDWDVTQDEVQGAVASWDKSNATTPDLVPRCVFKLGSAVWDQVVWLLMRLVGPGILALRPRVWRIRCMVPVFKKGDAVLIDSWRLIEVETQMGLLQELLIFNRAVHCVRAYLSSFQSGYIRDVGDAHLVLHEVLSAVISDDRCAWGFMGDLWKAFPHTWRQSLVKLLHDGPQIRGGCLALIGSVLEWDVVLVNQCGCSCVRVNQGVPEGGLLGAFGFTLLPDVLAKELQAADHGVGLDVRRPAIWQGHQWIGCGSPEPALVDTISAGLRGEIVSLYRSLSAKGIGSQCVDSCSCDLACG